MVYEVLIQILHVQSCCASNFEEIEPKKSKIDWKLTILEPFCVATFKKKHPVYQIFLDEIFEKISSFAQD